MLRTILCSSTPRAAVKGSSEHWIATAIERNGFARSLHSELAQSVEDLAALGLDGISLDSEDAELDIDEIDEVNRARRDAFLKLNALAAARALEEKARADDAVAFSPRALAPHGAGVLFDDLEEQGKPPLDPEAAEKEIARDPFAPISSKVRPIEDKLRGAYYDGLNVVEDAYARSRGKGKAKGKGKGYINPIPAAASARSAPPLLQQPRAPPSLLPDATDGPGPLLAATALSPRGDHEDVPPASFEQLTSPR
jgi:hypothetical protein